MTVRRRELIVGLGAAAVLCRSPAHAQATGRPGRVGVLSPGKPPPEDAFEQSRWFEAGLRERGWLPGTDLLIDYRYAAGKLDRLPQLAKELAGIPVDAIVARGLTIAAARQATARIPIVMVADPDPVRSGFVASLGRPGGNITGFSTQALDSAPKQLQLLREALPSASCVAVLTNGAFPDRDDMARIATAAATLRLKTVEFPITSSDQLPAAFTKMGEAAAEAVLVSPMLWFIDAKQLAAIAIERRLPTIHNLRQFAEAGVLMSYGADFVELHRRSAEFVIKLLKGADPAELPVEQPTKFELVVNLTTAQALRLDMPPLLLARADKVIE